MLGLLRPGEGARTTPQLTAEGTEAREADQPRLHDRAVEGSGTCALVVWLQSRPPGPPPRGPCCRPCPQRHPSCWGVERCTSPATAGPSLGPAHQLCVDTWWSKASGSGGTASQRIPPTQLGTCCSTEKLRERWACRVSWSRRLPLQSGKRRLQRGEPLPGKFPGSGSAVSGVAWGARRTAPASTKTSRDECFPRQLL